MSDSSVLQLNQLLEIIDVQMEVETAYLYLRGSRDGSVLSQFDIEFINPYYLPLKLNPDDFEEEGG